MEETIQFEITSENTKEKSAEDIEIINKVNQASNALLTDLGLESNDIGPDKFIIIKKDYWPSQINDAEGFATSGDFVVIREKESPIEFYETLYHEMTHLKSKKENDESNLFFTKNENSELVSSNINEALTTILTKSAVIKLKSDPQFKAEIEKVNQFIEADGQERTFSNDDIYHVESIQIGPEKYKVSVSVFSYTDERRMLNKLMQKIFEKNHQYKNPRDVLLAFAKAFFSGDMTMLTELINSSFGAYSAQKIIELDHNFPEQQKFVDTL